MREAFQIMPDYTDIHVDKRNQKVFMAIPCRMLIYDCSLSAYFKMH